MAEEIVFDKLLELEAYRITGDGVEAVKKVMANIESFICYVDEKWETILDKVSSIKAVSAENSPGAVVLDPTGKLFSTVMFEKLSDIVYMVRMEPPYVPHFLLLTAYLYKASGLIPSALIRTEPVYSLISLFVKGDLLAATALQVYAGLSALEHYVTGEAVMLPFYPELLDLPVTPGKPDHLYLTALGYSTRPLAVSGFNVEVDLTGVPGIDGEVYSKLKLTSLRKVLDRIAEVVR